MTMDFNDGPSAEDPGQRQWLLGLAVLALAISGALQVLGGTPAHVLGYVLASLLTFSLVALYRRHAQRRANLAGIALPRELRVLTTVVLLAGFALCLAHAYSIGRLWG